MTRALETEPSLCALWKPALVAVLGSSIRQGIHSRPSSSLLFITAKVSLGWNHHGTQLLETKRNNISQEFKRKKVINAEPKPAGMPHRNQTDMEGSPERGNAWLQAPPAQDADISTSVLVFTEAVRLWQVFMPNQMHVCRQGRPWEEWGTHSLHSLLPFSTPP